MSERQLQFRVGLFILVAIIFAGGMAFQFGDLISLLEKTYAIGVHFDEAPGVHPGSPVQTNGITIGSVRDVVIDEKRGGVMVVVDILENFRLRADTKPRLVRSLLGDATIEFPVGGSNKELVAGTLLYGESAVDPMEIVSDINEQLSVTMASFAKTSDEWQKVATHLNGLIDTNSGNLNAIAERAAISLEEFALTMKTTNEALGNANKLLADPRYQERINETLDALPTIAKETQEAIAAVRMTVEAAGKNLSNLERATEPIAKRSASIVIKLDNTFTNLEALSEEMALISQLATQEDGSLRKFVEDPQLYRNMNDSAESLALLLKNMRPIMADLRVFSDKIARHPELMGVGGALSGSSGLKDSPEPPRQAGGLLPKSSNRR